MPDWFTSRTVYRPMVVVAYMYLKGKSCRTAAGQASYEHFDTK